VIATASTVDKRRICTEKGGADEVVDYGKEGWQKEVLRITGGKGVDVVFDPVGTSSRPTHFHPCSNRAATAGRAARRRARWLVLVKHGQGRTCYGTGTDPGPGLTELRCE
jgi:threonine dehydrogenase-like Zn-dependent dehydrogenase